MPVALTLPKSDVTDSAVKHGGLPFLEQIAFFRGKTNYPTKTWLQVWRDAHDTSFMVAGASKEAIVQDFREAVRKAIEEGTTLATFRKDFDHIVAKYGWSYKGSRKWRSNIIYQTNLRASYAAGRYAQLTEPDFLKRHPYWEYQHSDAVIAPREQHVAWDGLILPASDDWWRTHWPPNGWGCRCRVRALSKEQAEQRQEALSKGKRIRGEKKEYQWKDRFGRKHWIPDGIDPGWNYPPGGSVAEQTRTALRRRGAVKRLLKPPPRRLIPAAEAVRIGADIWREVLAYRSSPTVTGVLAVLFARRRQRGERKAGRLPLDPHSHRAVRAPLQAAAAKIPANWIDFISGYGTLFVRETPAGERFAFSATGLRGGNSPWGGRRPFQDQGSIRGGEGFISIPRGKPHLAMHELAHRLQSAIPDLDSYYSALHRRRWRREGGKTERDDLDPDILYQVPAQPYPNRHFGRIYGERQRPLEVMSSAFEYAIGGDDIRLRDFADLDPELLHLTLGLLDGFLATDL